MNIIDNKILIAVIKRFSEWKDNLEFVTDEDKFIQVGTWKYNKGKTLDRHFHNISERKSNVTQECVFVVTGSLLIKFYSGQKFLKSVILNQFDYSIIFNGGHSYEILEDNTRVLETKNGPFPGLELDKTRY